MLNTKCIFIDAIGDYDKLMDCIPETHIDKEVTDEIKNILKLRCKSIIIESPYYESDYLSSYYEFYVKKMQAFPKECWRLLFFSDKQSTDIMGCISLRPTSKGTRIGRTYFEPKYLVSRKAYIILADQKIHFLGGETVLRVFPHMQQDGDVAVCAHIALWSVLRSFSSRFSMYPEMRLGKLIEMAQPNADVRVSSHGLTVSQIADVFSAQGFLPVICTNTSRNHQECTDEIISYIDSGIPVIGVASLRQHAVAIVGYGEYITSWQNISEDKYEHYSEIPQDEKLPKILLASRLVSDIVVNDDNFFPYRVVSRIPQRSETYFSSESGIQRFIMSEFDYAVIPLYPRVELLYSDVKLLFNGLVRAGKYNWATKIVVRIFLSSSNTYREYVNQYGGEFGSCIKNVLLHIKMSKLIWCVEVSEPEDFASGLVNSIILLDSTSSPNSSDVTLFMADKDNIWYLDDECGGCSIEHFSRLQVPRFCNNLEEVTPYGKN